MKVLLVNSHHQINGGTERYYFDLANLLKSKGHSVAFFSMQDTGNMKTDWSRYFVSNINFKNKSFKSYFKILLRSFYSIESKVKISRLLTDFRPDIVHINNIYYYISPSILSEIKKRHIPLVQTVHDYQLISPTTIMFYRGQIYENTKIHRYYKALFDRSVKDSHLGTLMAVGVSYMQYVFKFYERNVDLFITPSLFVKNKLIEYGFNREKITHLPNFVTPPAKSLPLIRADYLLYFGRICENKGIPYILKLAQDYPELHIKIVGRFTDSAIRDQVKSSLKNGLKNVDLIPHLPTASLNKLIRGCKFVLVPSIWYENQPYSVMEAFALGKPVVASNIGGLPEIVIHEKTGLLFDPNDYQDFKSQVLRLWNNPSLTHKLGQTALNHVTKKYNRETYYKKLMTVYRSVIK